MQRRILHGLGVALTLGVALAALVAATPKGAASTTSNGINTPMHCISIMVPVDEPLDSEMQRKVDEFSAQIGKPVSVERIGEHRCFDSEADAREYEVHHPDATPQR